MKDYTKKAIELIESHKHGREWDSFFEHGQEQVCVMYAELREYALHNVAFNAKCFDFRKHLPVGWLDLCVPTLYNVEK